jgi:CDP-glucose 4,6-dehydratase
MFGNIYYGKKVIVTGHTGFKGSWLSLWLLNLGAKVVGVSNGVPTVPSLFNELGLGDRILDLRRDVRDLEDLKKIFIDEKPDFVFHLAAQPIVSLSYTDPVSTFSTNVLGTVNVLESLRFIDNKCVAIIITSDKCYENVEWVWGYKENDHLGGKDIYSGSKGAAEIAFRSYFNSFFKNHKNVRIASARAGNVIGGGDWAKDRIVPDCINSWVISKPVEIRSPEATRPWQHVLEPLSGYLDLGNSLYASPELNGESFNFGPKSENCYPVIKLLSDLSVYWNFNNLDDAFKIVENRSFKEAGLLKLNIDKALFYLKWIPTLEYQELISFTSQWYYDFYFNKKDVFFYTIEQIKYYENLAKKKNLKWTL